MSLEHPRPGSPLPWQWDGGLAAFPALLTCFYPRFLLPTEGRLGRGESPSSGLVSGGRLVGSSVSRSQGCPRLCPHFGGSRLFRVARVHGQQGRLFWLSPQRARQVAWRLGGWGLASWAAMCLSPDSACSPRRGGLGPARRSQDKQKGVLAYGTLPTSSRNALCQT